jgi:uroporphyrinogen-III synthase
MSNDLRGGPVAADLRGKTILVTRPRERSRELLDAIARVHGRVLHLPMVEFGEPGSWDECDTAIRNLRQYDGVIFTSTTAVERFLGRVKECGGNICLLKSVFAVGKKTAERLMKSGLTQVHVSPGATSVSLADVMKRLDVKGKRFLFPRGNLSKDEIVEALVQGGAHVDAPVVYTTASSNELGSDEVTRRLEAESVDAITFFSPSAVRHFFELVPQDIFQRLFAQAVICVVGPTTRAELEQHGTAPHLIAEEASVDAVVQSLVDYFSVKSG